MGYRQCQVLKRYLLQQTGTPVLAVQSLVDDLKSKRRFDDTGFEYQMAEFKDSADKMVEIPCFRVSSLALALERSLDEHDYCERDFGEVPKGAVVTTLSADGGGGSTKVVLENKSLERVNSTTTSMLLASIEGEDKHERLAEWAGGLYKQHADAAECSIYAFSVEGSTRNKVLKLGSQRRKTIEKMLVHYAPSGMLERLPSARLKKAKTEAKSAFDKAKNHHEKTRLMNEGTKRAVVRGDGLLRTIKRPRRR